MKETRVMVRRERPTALAWSIALAVTMLAVYALTWSTAQPESARAAAAPRISRSLRFEAIEGWCVTLGAWPDAERAQIEAAGCAARGAAGCVYETGDGFHVLGALYDSENQARRVAQRLRDEDDFSADALPLEAPALSLRVTAPETQIELLEAADAMLSEQIVDLGDMAVQIEKGRLQPQGAQTLAALTATEAAAIAEKLSVFPDTDDPWRESLTHRLRALADQLSAISDSTQTDPTALAGMLRLAQIDTFMGLIETRTALSNGA